VQLPVQEEQEELQLPVVSPGKVQALFNQLHIQQVMLPLRLVLHRLEV
jgi:hypothetical protein